MRNEINFSRNWNNKLTGSSFISIRPKDVNRWHEGEDYCILLNRGHIAYATLVEVKHLLLYNISEQDARLDSGYSAYEFIALFKKLYAKEKIDFEKRMVSVLTFTKLKFYDVRKAKQKAVQAASETVEASRGRPAAEFLPFDGYEISDAKYYRLKDEIY